MGQQIVKQPNGKLAVFSSTTDTFVVVDATPNEVIEWRSNEAAASAAQRTRTELEHVQNGEPEKIYRQFALTWDAAVQLDREHGGDLMTDD